MRTSVAPIIAPLVARHAGDAAFYWQQRDTSVHSPLVGLPQLMEFDRLLDAHLDGLRVAEDAGWDCALEQLRRWQRAPQVFVCTLLALEHSEPGPQLSEVWSVVQTNPSRMLRGMISALAWGPAETSLGWCCHWLAEPRTPAPLVVAAWRALALRQSSPADEQPIGMEQSAWSVVSTALPLAIASSNEHVRAAACRWLAAVGQPQSLLPLFSDPTPRVRAEAAIGWIAAASRSDSQVNGHPSHSMPQFTPAQRLDMQTQAAGVLWLVTHAMVQELASSSGLPRSQLQHRLMRWLCHLGSAAPIGHAGIAKLLELLPPRLSLWFVLHHGDGRYLLTVEQYMADPEVARLAGWVWSSLTGIDLQNEGLALAPRGPTEAPRGTDIRDPGLPEPNISAIAQIGVALQPGVASLGGQQVNESVLASALWHAPQALRWIANQRLVSAGARSTDIRSRARTQHSVLARMHAQGQEIPAS